MIWNWISRIPHFGNIKSQSLLQEISFTKSKSKFLVSSFFSGIQDQFSMIFSGFSTVSLKIQDFAVQEHCRFRHQTNTFTQTGTCISPQGNGDGRLSVFSTHIQEHLYHQHTRSLKEGQLWWWGEEVPLDRHAAVVFQWWDQLDEFSKAAKEKILNLHPWPKFIWIFTGQKELHWAKYLTYLFITHEAGLISGWMH